MDGLPDHGEESYKGSGRLEGRKALITGADSGIGRAAAITYAREVAHVAINHLSAEEEDAKQVSAVVEKAGGKAVALPGDLRDKDFCAKLVEDAVAALGGLDILVNNAARQQTRAALVDISNEDFDATMKTNIYATFLLTKAALPHLKPGSAIIQTTSEQAYDPSKDLVDERRPSDRDSAPYFAALVASSWKTSARTEKAALSTPTSGPFSLIDAI
jgi:NAD(P)-dependent dehydrogenase (short-subunit alcohol dehydrogenase family)